MMEAAAVSLQHHHGALPLPAALPPLNHHHRRSLPVPPVPPTTTSRRPSVVRASSSKPPPALSLESHAHARSDHPAAATAGAHYSSRAATGYASALADACVRAGTLRRASRNARAFLSQRHDEEETMDARVAALVRMLVRKGRADMVAEVMAEFAAICHNLLPRTAQFHASAY